MKHAEIYDKHVDTRKINKAPKKKFKESIDRDARQRRLSFKNYVRDVEDEFLEDELAADDQQET